MRRPAKRQNLGSLHVLAIASTAGAVSILLAAPVSAGVVTKSSVLSSAETAIAQQTGAHVVFVAHSGSSSTTEKIIADVGTTSGDETIFEGAADVAIRVTPSFAYVSGDSTGLTTLFGMSAAEAKALGHKWEAWKSGTRQYSNLKSDLTMSSIKGLLPKSKGTALSVAGTGAYVLKWTSPRTSSIPKLVNTLTISSTPPDLPATKTSTASGGTKITTTVSSWGEGVVVQPPPAASTIASSKLSG